jgi:hypothetical protein
MAGLKKTLDMMLGIHLDAHIMGKPQLFVHAQDMT